MVNQRKRDDVVIGQHQGDTPPGSDAEMPQGGGIGQSGQAENPDRPANQGVEAPKPGLDDGRGDPNP
ncbi:hypothetical protein [Arenibaculum pallidiluteum]|uniref:hypothetical protein n=1 Tax=Arenibaculum pallidiluteum TaxID=2812559 RepID=UPI001A963371|nr:hypothetical protein [Arenibaculum pallidiluteum]